MTLKNQHIRNMDADLYRKIRVYAFNHNITVGEAVNKAIDLFLNGVQ